MRNAVVIGGVEVELTYSWSMPNHQTFKMKPVDEWIKANIPTLEGKPNLQGAIIDPFAHRPSDYGAVTNDINPESKVQFHGCALDFLKSYDSRTVGCVLYDPPYSLRQVKECYDGIGKSLTQHETQHFFSDIKNEIARVLVTGGVCLSFGWSSVGLGKNRGFEKKDLLLVCHGGIHNDTICLKEVKL